MAEKAKIIALYLITAIITLNAIFTWQAYKVIYASPIQGIDFNHYYATAWMVSHNIIPYGIRFDTTPLAGQFVWHDKITSATNPPFLAVLTSFLGIFPKDTAWVLWITIIVCSLIIIYITIRHEIAYTWLGGYQLLLLLMFFSHSSVIENIYFSQIQSIQLMFILLGWAMLRHKDSILGGLCWGITIAVKFYTLPLLLLLLVARRPKALISGSIIFLLLSYIPVAIFGNSIYSEYLKHGSSTSVKWATTSPYNLSVYGSLSSIARATGLDVNKSVLIVTVTMIAVVLLLCAAYFVACNSSAEIVFDWASGLFVTVSLAGTFLAWPSYYVFVLFFIALCIHYNEKSWFKLTMVVAIFIFTGNTYFYFITFFVDLIPINYLKIIVPATSLMCIAVIYYTCISKMRSHHICLKNK